MSEEVINYSGKSKSSWFQNKWRGLTNRYHKYKRYLLWDIHTMLNRIEPDYSKIDNDSIPILINNFNRLDLLRKQIDWLLSMEDKVSIIIIDNLSTFPPLLEFYENISHPQVQVVYLKFNSWRKGAEYLGEKKLSGFDKYIITDSDLLPFESTPKNLIGYLSTLIDKYPNFNHIGTSLEINDLPDHNPLKEKIVKHESQYWAPTAEVMNEEVSIALVDTTFAMYRNTSRVLPTGPALRTLRPYTLKHVDWYLDPNKNTAEHQYYLDSCKSFATWAHESKKEIKNTNQDITPDQNLVTKSEAK